MSAGHRPKKVLRASLDWARLVDPLLRRPPLALSVLPGRRLNSPSGSTGRCPSSDAIRQHTEPSLGGVRCHQLLASAHDVVSSRRGTRSRTFGSSDSLSPEAHRTQAKTGNAFVARSSLKKRLPSSLGRSPWCSDKLTKELYESMARRNAVVISRSLL